MKKEKKFVITFLTIIYAVLIFYGIKHALISSNIMQLARTDNWKYYEPIPEKNIFDKLENKFNSFKTNLENRADNYIPFYVNINELYQGSNFYTNKLFYDEIPIKLNNYNEYLFYNKKNNFYYYESNYDKKELEERLNKQVNFFNSLAEQGLEVYIYIPTRYELTKIKPNNLYSYIEEFEDKLDSKIKVTHMKIDSIEEYKEKFYATDHHWNAEGALDGYNSIMDMFKVSKQKNLKVNNVSPQKYYGSLAKTAMNTITYDYIQDIDINKKLNYDVLVNGDKPDELFKPRLLATDKTNKYYDYYIQYFNGQYGNVVYDYHKKKKENLLIMSDSYIWQIDYLIAASFNKTHVINLRYDEYKDNEFNLTKYVKENKIKKVLFLYEGEAILFDNYDYDFVGRVK